MLKVVNLKKTFDKGLVTEKEVLKGISLELKEGDLTKVAGGIPHHEYTETSGFAGNCGYFSTN